MGVDVTDVVRGSVHDNKKHRIWMRWNRWAMGVRQSSIATTRMCSIGLESIKGNRRDPNNIWSWERVEFNLPGQSNYNPSQPLVSKRIITNALAADTYIFVDDSRQTGHIKDVCDKATRSVASEGFFWASRTLYAKGVTLLNSLVLG